MENGEWRSNGKWSIEEELKTENRRIVEDGEWRSNGKWRTEEEWKMEI
jgi:hypothetical protein